MGFNSGFKGLKSTKFTLKHLKFAPTCFGPFFRPSLGGSWTVLYAVFCHRVYDKVSLSQVLQIPTQTDGNDIRPHTAQIYNERTSTDLNLVTA